MELDFRFFKSIKYVMKSQLRRINKTRLLYLFDMNSRGPIWLLASRTRLSFAFIDFEVWKDSNNRWHIHKLLYGEYTETWMQFFAPYCLVFFPFYISFTRQCETNELSDSKTPLPFSLSLIFLVLEKFISEFLKNSTFFNWFIFCGDSTYLRQEAQWVSK